MRKRNLFLDYQAWTLVLTAVVAAGSLLSAVASNHSAGNAGRSLQLAVEQSKLERTPVLVNSCELHIADKSSFPGTVLILRGRSLQSVMTSQVTLFGASGAPFTPPPLWIACTMANYGRLAAIDIGYAIVFHVGSPHAPVLTATLSIDAIAAGSSARFAIINDNKSPVYIDYPETILLSDPSMPDRHPYRIWNPHRFDYVRVKSLPPAGS